MERINMVTPTVTGIPPGTIQDNMLASILVSTYFLPQRTIVGADPPVIADLEVVEDGGDVHRA